MNWSAAVLALVIGVVTPGAGHAQDAQALPAVCESLDAQYKRFIEMKHGYANEIASLANNIVCQQSNFSDISEKNAFFEKLNSAKSKWNTEIDRAATVMRNRRNINGVSIDKLNNLYVEMNSLKEKSSKFRNCAKIDEDKFAFIIIPAVYMEMATIASGIASIYVFIDAYQKNVKERDDDIEKEWKNCADSIGNLKL